jgi:hypothetical protein
MFKGMIDDFRIYNRALSANEAAILSGGLALGGNEGDIEYNKNRFSALSVSSTLKSLSLASRAMLKSQTYTLRSSIFLAIALRPRWE